MGQKEDPVNIERLVRDFRAIMGISWPIRNHSARPSLRALIAAQVSSVAAHFSRSDIGLEMDPKLGYR